MESSSSRGGRYPSSLLGGAAIIFLLIPTGVAIYLMSQKGESVSPLQSSAFDIQTDMNRLAQRDAPPRAPLREFARQAPPEHEEASPDSLMVYYAKGAQEGGAPAQKSGDAPGKISNALKGLRWAADFVKNPAQFMFQETFIGKPETAKRFLRDPKKVEGYLQFPLTKYVLEKPAVAAALMQVPGVVSIIMTSPSAKDSGVIAALVESGMVSRVMESPSAVALMKDPKFLEDLGSDPEVRKALNDPSLMMALAKSPSGMKALTALSGGAGIPAGR